MGESHRGSRNQTEQLVRKAGSNGDQIVIDRTGGSLQVDRMADVLLDGVEAVVDNTEIDNLAVVIARDMRDAMRNQAGPSAAARR